MGLLLEIDTLTQAAPSYVLLWYYSVECFVWIFESTNNIYLSTHVNLFVRFIAQKCDHVISMNNSTDLSPH